MWSTERPRARIYFRRDSTHRDKGRASGCCPPRTSASGVIKLRCPFSRLNFWKLAVQLSQLRSQLFPLAHPTSCLYAPQVVVRPELRREGIIAWLLRHHKNRSFGKKEIYKNLPPWTSQQLLLCFTKSKEVWVVARIPPLIYSRASGCCPPRTSANGCSPRRACRSGAPVHHYYSYHY